MERRAWLALGLALAGVAIATLSPGIVGLFHDDGVYLVTAKALAEHGEYRIASLPGQPLQSKYPPLYSAMLALAWRAFPNFPENLFWLKALNGGLVAMALYATSRLARRSFTESRSATFAVVVLLGTSPGVIGFCDFTMSDVLFLSLVTSTLAVDASSSRERWTVEAAVAALTAAALLTRSVGVCLAAAVVLERLLRRRWRAAILHAATSVLVAGAWAACASFSRDRGAGPVLEYYLAYEKSALAYLHSDPRLAWSIVSGNLSLARDSALLVVGPAWPLIAPLYMALAVIGVHALVRDGAWLPLLFVGAYLPAVLAHPFAPHRYLVPVLPVFAMAVVAGAARAGKLFARDAGGWSGIVALIAAAPLIFGNVAWWRHRVAPLNDGHVRGWYGVDMGYRWEGFQESFDWIRTHTPADARLASVFDPMYFLFTGRQSVRPWIHHSETYFYPYGNARPFVGKATEVAKELRRLRIDYLVLDPPTGFAEGEAAMQMLRELVNLPEVTGSLVFRSSDRKHEVYRLWQTGNAP
jgi:hypothetical protein